MAGKYVELTNPGYSSLFTRDLAWAPNTGSGESASDNAFDPDASNPLHEGEWLEMRAPGSGKGTVFMRGGPDVVRATAAGAALAVAGGGNDHGVGVNPAYLHFQERGRYDAQLTKKAHSIVGPSGFEFRTRMVVTDGSTAPGDKLFVCWGVLPSGAYVRCLATAAVLDTFGDAGAAGDWFCGVVTRVHGTNDVSAHYQPGFQA